MDNAIRFDDAKMLKNDGAEDAWSMDQESVDLNAYLALECKLLKKFAGILGVTFDGPDYSSQVADYFFDKEKRFLLRSPLKRRKLHTGTGMRSIHPLMDKSCHGRSGKSHAAPADRYSQVFYIHSLPHSGSRPSEVQSSWLLARSYLVGPDLLRYPRPAQLWI